MTKVKLPCGDCGELIDIETADPSGLLTTPTNHKCHKPAVPVPQQPRPTTAQLVKTIDGRIERLRFWLDGYAEKRNAPRVQRAGSVSVDMGASSPEAERETLDRINGLLRAIRNLQEVRRRITQFDGLLAAAVQSVELCAHCKGKDYGNCETHKRTWAAIHGTLAHEED